jgi:hypothetical protein
MYHAIKQETGIFKKMMIPFRSPSYLGSLIRNSERTELSVKVSAPLKRYVFFQFLLLIWGVMSYMIHFGELNIFYRFLFFSIIILTLLSCAAILESKTWVKVPEILRLVTIVIALNFIYKIQYPDWHLLLAVLSVFTFILSTAWFIYRWSGLTQQKI